MTRLIWDGQYDHWFSEQMQNQYRDEAAFALGMNDCDHRCRHPPEPQPGGLEAGPCANMGTPYDLPDSLIYRLRARVRQRRRR